MRCLYAYLRQAGLITCSLSSVYRVLRRCGALVRRPRKPKPIWTRYAKENPGERAQMDLKYLPQGRYQLTLVDDCSRFLAATVLEKRTTAAVCKALPGLLETIPFPLRCLQTDNGSEFGRDLTRLLHHLGIRHTRIRPRCPHLNGKVERVQRTVQEESRLPAGRSGMASARGPWTSGSASFRATCASTTVSANTAPWATPPPCSMLYSACPVRPVCLTSPEALQAAAKTLYYAPRSCCDWRFRSSIIGEPCAEGPDLAAPEGSAELDKGEPVWTHRCSRCRLA